MQTHGNTRQTGRGTNEKKNKVRAKGSGTGIDMGTEGFYAPGVTTAKPHTPKIGADDTIGRGSTVGQG